MLLLPVAFWTTIHKHECDLSIEGGEGANVILCYNICDRDCSLKKSGKTAKFNDWFTIRVITGKSTDIHCFKTEAGTGSRQDLMVILLSNSEISDCYRHKTRQGTLMDDSMGLFCWPTTVLLGTPTTQMIIFNQGTVCYSWVQTLLLAIGCIY